MESWRTEIVSDQYGVVPGWVPPWVERVGAPVWVCDLNHKIIYVNPRTEELLGRPAGRCIASAHLTAAPRVGQVLLRVHPRKP